MIQQILSNYCMGFISARETAAKLLDANFPEEIKTCLNEKIRENMERIRIEQRSYNPCVNKVNEILAVVNYDRSISVDQFVRESVLVKQMSVTLYASWTDARGTFEFDNYCEQDNAANLEALKKWVEEN